MLLKDTCNILQMKEGKFGFDESPLSHHELVLMGLTLLNERVRDSEIEPVLWFLWK
jgi:hypothetical protein